LINEKPFEAKSPIPAFLNLEGFTQRPCNCDSLSSIIRLYTIGSISSKRSEEFDHATSLKKDKDGKFEPITNYVNKIKEMYP
jgi:hypothetical protein